MGLFHFFYYLEVEIDQAKKLADYRLQLTCFLSSRGF